jgi:hypothetical protein
LVAAVALLLAASAAAYGIGMARYIHQGRPNHHTTREREQSLMGFLYGAPTSQRGNQLMLLGLETGWDYQEVLRRAAHVGWREEAPGRLEWRNQPETASIVARLPDGRVTRHVIVVRGLTERGVAGFERRLLANFRQRAALVGPVGETASMHRLSVWRTPLNVCVLEVDPVARGLFDVRVTLASHDDPMVRARPDTLGVPAVHPLAGELGEVLANPPAAPQAAW